MMVWLNPSAKCWRTSKRKLITLRLNQAKVTCCLAFFHFFRLNNYHGVKILLNLSILDCFWNVSKVTPSGAWLGLHIKADSKFYWTDDTLLSGYNAWIPGEPNNPSGEKCSNIVGSGSLRGMWNDRPCKMNKRYITHAPVILCQRKSN